MCKDGIKRRNGEELGKAGEPSDNHASVEREASGNPKTAEQSGSSGIKVGHQWIYMCPRIRPASVSLTHSATGW